MGSEYENIAANIIMSPSQDCQINLVDVGSAGGLQAKWMPYIDFINPILFEPNPVSAERLRKKLPNANVLEVALSNAEEIRKLYLTKNPFCVSVLKPNHNILLEYPNIQPNFVVGKSVNVECTRYDILHNNGLSSIPDVIKIDVQGFEYEVLEGFGGLLDSCLAIELETHFYPIYQGQKLLHNIIELLDKFELVLRKLEYVPHFRGDLVEANAYFTKRQSLHSTLSSNQRWILQVAQQVWQLPVK